MLFFLVYLTQSLVGALLFVFNPTAVKVYLFLQLLAQLQKKMRIFLSLALGDRYAFNLTLSLKTALLSIDRITQKTRYAAYNLPFLLLFSFLERNL